VKYDTDIAALAETEVHQATDGFSVDVVASDEHDAESDANRLVAKPTPADNSAAMRQVLDRVSEQEQEIDRLRNELAAGADESAGSPVPATIGVVVGDRTDLLSDLTDEVLCAELHRRLPSVTIRSLAFDQNPASVSHTMTGRALIPLRADGPLGLDALIVSGGVKPGGPGTGGDETLSLFTLVADDLVEPGSIFAFGVRPSPNDTGLSSTAPLLGHVSYVGRPGASTSQPQGPHAIPEPLVLVDRLRDAASLNKRVAYLRLMGWIPTANRIMAVQATAILKPHLPGLVAALGALAEDSGIKFVIFETSGSPDDVAVATALTTALSDQTTMLSADNGALAVLAMVHAADLIMSSSPQMLAVSVGLGRPAVGLDFATTGAIDDFAEWCGDTGVVVTTALELVQCIRGPLFRGPLPDARDTMQSALDHCFDHVADLVGDCTSPLGRTRSRPAHVAFLERRVGVLEAVNDGLGRQLAAERLRFAEHAAKLTGRPVAGGDMRSQIELERTQLQLDQARQEIQAIYGTRTMRAVGPARRLYSRMRKFLG
jgi:hypothetical protein